MARTTAYCFRGWLVLTSVLLSMLALGSTVFADQETSLGGDRFEIIEASARAAYFTIIDGDDCSDTDENCTAKVTSNKDITDHSQDGGATNHEVAWKNVFEGACTISGSDEAENEDFEECWAGLKDGFSFDVSWPIILPDAKFDIRPHCDEDDTACAVELGICYNPEDCRDGSSVKRARDMDEASNQIADFWDDAGSCLYDDDEDDVWECIDDEFQDWLDDELSSNDDYDDLIDELERSSHDDLGLSILDYDDDLNEVEDADDDEDEDTETRLERYQRQWRTASPTNIFRNKDEVDEGPYSFPPTADDYLTVNLTRYLDYEGPLQVCNTVVGCFTLTGRSTFFRQYMQNFFVVITDSKVMRCMDNAGWDTDDDHAIPFNHPDLIACDTRIKTAVAQCPAENIGSKYTLFTLYDIGLLGDLLAVPANIHQMRLDVEQARVRAPGCLCAAGFKEQNMVLSGSRGDMPWEYSGARQPQDLCD